MILMNRRDYLKAAGGLALGTALAGCSGDTKGEENEYQQLNFETVATNLRDYDDDKIRVKGHIQYEGQEEWHDGSKHLKPTYHFYADDPSKYDDPEDELAWIDVVEDDFTPLQDALPEQAILQKEPMEIELYGRADIEGPKEDQPDPPYIEAHAAKLLEEPRGDGQ